MALSASGAAPLKTDTYSKFQPWTQSGVYEGFLRVECDGEVYRIERRFQKGVQASVRDQRKPQENEEENYNCIIGQAALRPV